MPIKWPRVIIFIVLFAVLGAALLLLLFFLPTKSKDVDDIIKVGILHSLTGPMAGSEKPIVDAAQLAIDEINESGGVLGKKIVAVVADGKSDWPTFAQEAERLITEDQVKAIFGCWTSASRKMVKPVVEKYNNLLFYPVQHESLETSQNIVYLGSSANQQAIPAVSWCLQNLGQRLFLVGTDYIYQHAINSIIKDLVAARYGSVVGEEYISLAQADIDNVINKIKETKPEVIISTINGKENDRFFEALTKAGFSSERMPTMSLSVTETELAEFNIDAMIGDYATQNYFESLNTPANKAFVNKFKEKYGADRVISSPMQNAYSALYFWKNAVFRAETTDTDAVRVKLRDSAFSAPEGIVSIDAKTLHAWKPVLVGKIFHNKQFGIVFNSVSTLEPLTYPPFRTKKEWDEMLEYWYKKWGNRWAKD